MDYATDYIADWRHHDFVETASYYGEPNGDAPRQGVQCKAKLEDLDGGRFDGVGSPSVITTNAHGCVVWPSGDEDLDIEVNGTLRLVNSGTFVVVGRRQSRFGHWILAVIRERVNDPVGI